MSYTMIKLAKRLGELNQNALRYRFDQNLTMGKGTTQPFLVLQGDYDPLTNMQVSRDYFGDWLGTPKSNQYSFVMPFAAHGLLENGLTTLDPEHTCGMQLIASFVKNGLRVRDEDTLCLRRPVPTDFSGKRQDTLESFQRTFNTAQTYLYA